MIVLFTDFSVHDPYQGQLHAAILKQAPSATVIDLFAGVPSFNIKSAAYLLPAYINEFPAGSVFLCVIDPGVGSQRDVVIVNVDGRWLVGPDNGLFNVVAKRATQLEWRKVLWRPENLSDSFHGRDWFAPIAVRLSQGDIPESEPVQWLADPAWPDDLHEIVYIDHYGNAISGLRGSQVESTNRLRVDEQVLDYARTFSAVDPGQLFWYINSNGLVEIAMNQGSAAETLDLAVGSGFAIE